LRERFAAGWTGELGRGGKKSSQNTNPQLAPDNYSMRLVAAVALFLLLSAANAFTVITPTCTRHCISERASAADDISSTEKTTASAKICHTLSRHDGHALMDSTLLPISEYGSRIKSGRDAQGLTTSVAVSPNDPCLYLTYGEFPLSSLDELLDLALPYVSGDTTSIRMVDVGSGCGRLVLYAALTRGTPERQPWHVHGIEISPILHNMATLALSRGFQGGSFTDYQHHDSATSSIHLHLGAADEWTQVLQQCNLVFAYSTVFHSSGFSEEWGAMIMDKEWSGLLSHNCPTGCVVVATDRALDPNDGWDLIDRLDVENREVMGSTGYIHVLRR
jgi:hypothetical protein